MTAEPTRRRILGIDPGTLTVGYGVLDPQPLARSGVPFRYVECGVIQAPKKERIAGRLRVVARALDDLIEEFQPGALAIEKAYHGRNAASALKLGQARGAIMLVASRRELEVFEYAPAKIKKVVAGNGRATKQQIQQRVQLLFRLRKEPAVDAADALAIALCHGHSLLVGAVC